MHSVYLSLALHRTIFSNLFPSGRVCLQYNRMVSVKQALEHWKSEGLLTGDKVRELERSLATGGAEIPNRAIGIFSAIGGVLVGLGVILFVGSNWDQLTPLLKVIVLLIGMLGTGFAGFHFAYERGDYEKTGFALLFVNVLIFGASIFLVAQIYNLPLNFWWGALLWFGGALIFAYILTSRLHLWLSVPLFLLFLGWLRISAVTGFSSEFDFVFTSRQSLLPLLPLLGAGILSVSILSRGKKYFSFGVETLFNWGLFLVILAVVISTADKSVFYTYFRFPTDTISLIVTAASIVAFAAAIWRGTFVTAQGRYGLLALALYIAFIFILAWTPTWMGLSATPDYTFGGLMDASPAVTGFYILHIVLAAVFFLTAIWYGTILRMPAVINMGMIAIALLIFIQYFSWAFALLDRSFAFILGGVIVLALSAALERKRRELLMHMRT